MSNSKVYFRSLRMLWSEPFLATALVIAGICTALIQLLEPLLFGRVIDSVSTSTSPAPTLIVWAGLGFFNVIASVFLAVVADRLAHRRRLTVMGDVFERVISLPISFHAERGSGRVVRAILTGTDQLFTLWLSFLREYLPSIVGCVVLIPMAIGTDWRLASLLFVLAAFYLIANSIVVRRTQGKQASIEGYHQDVFGRVGDVLGNVTVVQSYTRLIDETNELQQIMARLLTAQYPVLTWWGFLTVLTRISATLTMVSILAMGSWLAARGEISVGRIVAFTAFAGLMIGKLDQLSAFFTRMVNQAAPLKNFFELLDVNISAQDRPGARELNQVVGAVKFTDVTYHYGATTTGVHKLNFEVGAGQTVALVGPSGSGKTTTLALLQRLFDPSEGSICIDGSDIREFTLTSLRHNVATVFQDSGLFNRSIAENILVGRPSATQVEIEAAARDAEAEEFILAKPGGYQFPIGERGASLSGGERQRIAIARAILKNAPILIFDEATSALDTETERKIQSALSRLRQGKTTFIIAHRLSTIIDADHILVFNGGRIVESGTFRQLKKANGLFARLLSASSLNSDRELITDKDFQ